MVYLSLVYAIRVYGEGSGRCIIYEIVFALVCIVWMLVTTVLSADENCQQHAKNEIGDAYSRQPYCTWTHRNPAWVQRWCGRDGVQNSVLRRRVPHGFSYVLWQAVDHPGFDSCILLRPQWLILACRRSESVSGRGGRTLNSASSGRPVVV
jgi:hypothetical protein